MKRRKKKNETSRRFSWRWKIERLSVGYYWGVERIIDGGEEIERNSHFAHDRENLVGKINSLINCQVWTANNLSTTTFERNSLVSHSRRCTTPVAFMCCRCTTRTSWCDRERERCFFILQQSQQRQVGSHWKRNVLILATLQTFQIFFSRILFVHFLYIFFVLFLATKTWHVRQRMGKTTKKMKSDDVLHFVIVIFFHFFEQ